MQSSGTFKLIPLAPPATTSVTTQQASMRIPSSHRDETNRFPWPSWLSPKITRPNSPFNRRHTDNVPDRPAATNARRTRRASFDEPLAAAEADNDDDPRPSRGNAKETRRPSSQNKNAPYNGPSKSSSPQQSSLLTAFLFNLNDLLPDYCNLLATSANMGQDNAATRAIHLLDRKSYKRMSAPSHWNDATGSPIARQESPQYRGSPSRSPTFSPTQFLKQLSAGSPRRPHGNYAQHASLSPMHRHPPSHDGHTPRSAPTSPQSKKILLDSPTMNKTTANEWERFVSPFLLLAAAEVLYGRMEHVVDPASEARFWMERRSDATAHSSSSGDEQNDARSQGVAFRIPFFDCVKQECLGGQRKPLVTFGFTPRQDLSTAYRRVEGRGTESVLSAAERKRGSQRLLAMYGQIRDDLVIVGEYLCDPVLGSRAAGCRREDGMGRERKGREEIPPLPYRDDESVSVLKPKRSHGDEDNELVNDEEGDPRRAAALSLRVILSNLISFVEARCTLIQIHADIIGSLGSEDPWSSKKWVDIIQKCESISSCGDFMARVDREAKALKLAMEIIKSLEDFDFFHCALNTRRLFVLLGPTPTHSDVTFLPIMWIRSSFVRLLSLIRIMFSEAELFQTMPQQKVSQPLSSNKKVMHKKDESNSFSAEVCDFEVLSSEIISSNGLDPPLAIVIAHKTRDNSWTAIYVKYSAQTDADSKKETTPVSQNQRSRSIWPLTMWPQIENCLEKHAKECETRHAKYDIDSSVCVEAESTQNTDASLLENKKSVAISGKKQVSSHPGNLLQCHITTIAKQICLAIIRGAESPSNNVKKRKVSDDDISKFMELSLPQLIPENVLGVDVLLTTRTAMVSSTVNTKESNHPQSISTLKTHFSSSLWDGSEWSEKKQKHILSTLGLRKNSPVIAPLKSPYIKRHLGEAGRRRKKTKSTMNHGHLAFFLGTELSQII